jgi:transcriptional regulator of heat shock response
MVDKKRKYNIESLQIGSTKYLYQQGLNNKLNQNEFTDTEEIFNYLQIVFMKQQKEALGEKEVNKGRKTIFWDAEIEKERQNKKQLFLKWVSTKEYNDTIQKGTSKNKKHGN